MSNFSSSYSNFGYLALKEQSSAAAVIPDTYVRIKSQSLVPDYKINPINEIAGDRERMITSVQGQIEVGGDIELYVEEKQIGHFLNSLCGSPTSQTMFTSTAARHVFEIKNTLNKYTIDIALAAAPWVHRFYGCAITKLAFGQDNNAIKCTASVMPTKAFISARVTTAASSGTALLVDQTDGLVATDTLLVIRNASNGTFTTVGELTVTSVTDGTTLVVSTIGVSIAVGDVIHIKRAASTAVTYVQCQPFQFSNGTGVFTGDDIDNTAERITEDFSVELENDMERHFGSGLDEGKRYPYDIVIKGYKAKAKLSKFFDSDEYLDRLRANDRMGIRYFMQGSHYVVANSATKARSNWGSGNGFYVEAATAGKAGNDYNITTVINTTDTLAASFNPVGSKNILLKLANTTAANNTGTLIAAALDALTGIDAAAVGTGAETFTTAEANVNLGFHSSGTNVVGTDASQKPYLQFDFASASVDSYFPGSSDDSVVMEEIPLTIYKDVDCTNPQNKLWSTRIFLYNSILSY